MSALALNEFFCFTDARTNFDVDPVRDASFLFGDEKWGEGIRQQLRRSIALDRPLRIVWIGQYGIGKTHRIHHTMFLIKADDMALKPIPVTCTDIGDKTGFESLQYQLVSNLGFDFVRDLTRKYVRRIEDGDNVPLPEEVSQSRDVASAIRKLGSDDELAAQAWQYLAGLPVQKDFDYTKYLKVTKPVLNTSVEYASVLGCIGTIMRVQTGKTLLYLVDQMEGISKITNKATAARWVETLRAILDLKTVGFAAAVGAESESLDELPRIFLEPEIVRRFGQDNYIQMKHFQPIEMEKFLQQMLKVWVDAAKLSELATQQGWTQKSEFDPDTYPFTRPAFNRMARHLAADAERAKPSVVIETLNMIAAEAFLADKRLIGDEVLDENGVNA